MVNEQGYTAEEVAEILQSEGDTSISKRTVNYYAFDKGMFEVKLGGKGIFTEAEIDKLRAIRMLKECTAYTLEQIKRIINTQSLDDIKQLCLKRAAQISYPHSVSELNGRLAQGKGTSELRYRFSETNRTIKINKDITLIVSENIDSEKLSSIVRYIKNLK